MVRRIRLFGEDILRQRAKPVKAIDASVRRLIDDLVETMEDAEGLGLAATQIGVAKRVFVARDGDQILAFVNPTIVARHGREVGLEGCLSLPGLQGNVPRAKEITIRALDRAGRTISHTFTGLAARCCQHEYDHLNGVMYVDHTKDLFWLEAAAERVDLPEDDETSDHWVDEGGQSIQIVRVPTDIREITDYYAELIADLDLDAAGEHLLAEDDGTAPATDEVTEDISG